MSLSAIQDQEVALRLLVNVLRTRRIPNGLLFWGPPGVGKRTTAIEFSKALNCGQTQADACDACLSCRRIANGNHPDVLTVAPSSKSRMIVVKTIEETVIEMASLRPFEAKYRVFVILDAERMNTSAQNKFLKTLEEPPGQSVFILVSEYPRLLLPTIRSRCQAVRFRALREQTVASLLQRDRDLPPDTAVALARLSGGEMTRALDLVDNDRRDTALSVTSRLAGGEDASSLAEEFAKLMAGKRKQIEAAAKAELAEARADPMEAGDAERVEEEILAKANALVKRDILEYLYLFETWYRDEMVFAEAGDERRVWNHDCLDRLSRSCSRDAAAKIAAIEKARDYLDRNIPEERVFRDLFFTLAEP